MCSTTPLKSLGRTLQFTHASQRIMCAETKSTYSFMLCVCTSNQTQGACAVQQSLEWNKDAKNHEKMHTHQIENQVHIQPSINYSREQTFCSELTRCIRKPLAWCTVQHVYVAVKQYTQFIGNDNDQGKHLYVWSTDMEHPVRTAYSSSHLSYKPSLWGG